MTGLVFDQGLFGRLRRDAGGEWTSYVAHGFVRQLGQGVLAKAAFQHFLKQDYLFLIHFARAYALAAVKSDTLEDLRGAAAAVTTIVDVEMPLHVAYCRDWGLDEAQMLALVHRDPSLTIPLCVSSDPEEIATAWRIWTSAGRPRWPP